MFRFAFGGIRSRVVSPRRRPAASRIGLEMIDNLEHRALLSATAPAPAAQVAPAAQAATVEPASANGTWSFDTDLIDGKIAITQTGVKAKTTLEYGIFKLVGKGVIRNENLILKFKGFVGPFNAKAKVTASLIGGDGFSGVIKGKLPVIGKFSTPITASLDP